MNVLFVTNTNVPHLGGKSSHICDLRDGLCAIGDFAAVISATSVSDNIGVKTKMRKIPCLPYKWLDPYEYSWRSLEITDRAIQTLVKKYLSENKVDVISAQDPASALKVYEIVGDSIPIVLTMHSYFGKSMSDISGDKFRKAQKHFDRIRDRDLKCLDVIKGLVGVDTRIKEDCDEFIKQREGCNLPTYVIPNFVNTETYKPASIEEKKRAKQSLGISEEKSVAICIRRLVDKNGVIFAAQAMKALRNSNIVLLVGGDGPCKNQIESFINENGLNDCVKLMGGVDGEIKMNMYAAADFAIVPSITVNGLQEATSISAIEAMSCGLILIASEIGGLKELLVNMENGILVEERNAQDIANALQILVHDDDLKKSISSKARETVMNRYSHIYGAKRYRDVFVKAIHENEAST